MFHAFPVSILTVLSRPTTLVQELAKRADTHGILPAITVQDGGVARFEVTDDKGQNVGGHDGRGGKVLPCPVGVQWR